MTATKTSLSPRASSHANRLRRRRLPCRRRQNRVCLWKVRRATAAWGRTILLLLSVLCATTRRLATIMACSRARDVKDSSSVQYRSSWSILARETETARWIKSTEIDANTAAFRSVWLRECWKKVSVFFIDYSQTPLNMDIITDSLLCLWWKKALTFALNSIPLNTDTLLMQTLSMTPSVSVFTGFDYICAVFVAV